MPKTRTSGRSFLPLTAVLTSVAAIAVSASVAFAAVSYNPAAGGFAGKGDVQSALGLNDKQLVALYEAGGIDFTYQGVATYEQACTKVTEGGPPTERVVKATTTVDLPYILQVPSTIVTVDNTKASGKDAGKKSITGFQLNGVTLPQAPTSICQDDFQPYDGYTGDLNAAFDAAYWGEPTSPLFVGGNGILKVNNRPLPNTAG